jgi:hypothetical protein
MDPDLRRFLLLVGALAGYGLLMVASPVRASLRDGARCVFRHKQLWALPASFGFVHAVFRQWVRWFETSLIPGSGPFVSPWKGWQPTSLSDTLSITWLPTLESVAGIFDCMVDTFPLSAGAAALFLGNWRGYQGAMHRGLRRRFGLSAGLLIHAGLVACALAAAVKPVLFGGLPRLNAFFGADALLRLGELVNWLGFVFEYLLGVAIQVYLILLCFVWLKGLSFDFHELRRFALRRFASVVKWSGAVLFLSTLSLHLPLLMASFRPVLSPGVEMQLAQAITVARWLLALVILGFFSLQMVLTFHNEPLPRALADHWRLVRSHGWRVGWLGLTAFAHFLLLGLGNSALRRGWGETTWPAMLWSLCYPLLWAGLAGWFLASWVCLYRRFEIGQPDADDLVKF